jgi:hypothetical protein
MQALSLGAQFALGVSAVPGEDIVLKILFHLLRVQSIVCLSVKMLMHTQ